VLRRYEEFKDAARIKRQKLEESRRFHYFRRDADELELWIHEKLQAASEESYKDPTNLQAKIQKHQAFEAEVRRLGDLYGVFETDIFCASRCWPTRTPSCPSTTPETR
jgi:hypothetical protein